MPIDDSYNTVAERIEEFKEKFPDGRLRPADPEQPYQVVEVGNKTFLVYRALAYRTPEDPLPGFGCAWEPFPGPTAFTRDSELQNVETSAWGRAIVAALVASTKKGVATREEVDSRRANVAPLAAYKPSEADKARHPARALTSGHALAEAAARAGFTPGKDDDDDAKAKIDAARRDVLEAATGHRSTRELTTAAAVKKALDAFNGLADGTKEFGYDEAGVPVLRDLVPS